MSDTKTITINESKSYLGLSCVICGEVVQRIDDVELLDYSSYITTSDRVCDKCKQAVMKMREMMGSKSEDSDCIKHDIQAHWIYDSEWGYCCSECHYQQYDDFKYCPNCGVKMNGVK